MLTKRSDTPYCGVSESRIKEANPTLSIEVLAHLKTFIRDRYDIHFKKDVQLLPPPWTDNVVLQKGKFTNVRREHDRQTKNYVALTQECTSWYQKFWNTVLFRMFNHANPFAGEPFDIHRLVSDDKYVENIRARFTKMEQEGVALFTNAFNTGGLKQSLGVPEGLVDSKYIQLDNGDRLDYRQNIEKFRSGELKCKAYEPNMGMRIIRAVRHYAGSTLKSLHDDVFNAQDQKAAYELLNSGIRGLSRFLAYQIFVDLTYQPEFPFSENEFTVSGPGCDAGLDLLFTDRDGMTYEECLFWLRDNSAALFHDIDFNELMFDLQPHDRCMNVMSLENCFCELQKYIRARNAIDRGEAPKFKVTTARLETPPTTKQENSLW